MIAYMFEELKAVGPTPCPLFLSQSIPASLSGRLFPAVFAMFPGKCFGQSDSSVSGFSSPLRLCSSTRALMACSLIRAELQVHTCLAHISSSLQSWTTQARQTAPQSH